MYALLKSIVFNINDQIAVENNMVLWYNNRYTQTTIRKPSKQRYANNFEHKFITQQLQGYYVKAIILVINPSDTCKQCALTHVIIDKHKLSIIKVIHNIVMNIDGYLSIVIVLWEANQTNKHYNQLHTTILMQLINEELHALSQYALYQLIILSLNALMEISIESESLNMID